MSDRSFAAPIAGATRGFVAAWLTSLLAAAVWAVDQRYHPVVFVFSLILIPAISVAGALTGAVAALVIRRIRGHTGRADETTAMKGAFRRAAAIMATGTVLVVACTIAWAFIEHRPVAKLASLGGEIGYHTGEVVFPQGTLADEQLPAVVECLNEIDHWYHLTLRGTHVTGSGLRHLRSIEQPYLLTLSPEHFDEDGRRHLDGLTNVVNADDLRNQADRAAAQAGPP